MLETNSITLKAKLRRRMLSKRNSMSNASITKQSEIIQDRFLALNEFRHSQTMASYYSFGSEVRTFRIIEKAFENHMVVALPKIDGEDMDFYKIEPYTVFYTNQFGIKEPAVLPTHKVSNDLDLLLVPGLAFDIHGYRTGYGYGYYDRFLADKGSSIICVGLAYDSQVVQEIPHQSHDRKLDILLTDSRIFYF